MKKSLISSLFARTAPRRDAARTAPKFSALRAEPLESRDLLSVAPGSEFFAAETANICGCVGDGIADDKVVDLSEALLDAAATPETTSIVVTTNLDVVDSSDEKISLREALVDANSGDTITFASSLKGKTIKLKPKLGELTVNKSITIDASNLWNATTSEPGLTISGEGASRILYVYQDNGDANVEINGITFTNGYADYGGAICNNDEKLTLNNCSICYNEADEGGGVVSAGGETTLINCAVTNNSAGSGGGVHNYESMLFLVNCSICDNEADEGGGVFSWGGELTLTNCAVTDNIAANDGGGVDLTWGAALTATNCLVADNDAPLGGGLCLSGNATLYNCTITDSAAYWGAILLRSADVVLNAYNTIIASNYAGDKSYDIWLSSDDDVVNLYNSLLRHITDGSSNAAINLDNCYVYDPAKPLFTNAASGDYTLAEGSQAIDRGNNQYVTTSVDLAGNPRILNRTVDIGAYEYLTSEPVQLAAPTNPRETAKTETTVAVAWDDVPNASGYKLAWKNTTDSAFTDFVTVDEWTTSYELTGLDNSATYYWRVLALGDGVDYADSAYTAARTVMPRQRLARPTISYRAESTTITASWDAVPNAERYSFSYKLASESTWKSVNVGTNTEYTVTGLEPNTQYDLRLKAIGDDVNYKSIYSAVVHAKTKPTTVQLAAPVPSVAAKTATTITASWEAVPNASGYRFIWKNQSDASFGDPVFLDGETTSYKLTGLDNGAVYVWKVLALGDKVSFLNSSYCATQRDKPQQTLPAPSVAVSPATTSLTINWSAVDHVDRYSVSYKPTGETTWTNKNAGTNTSYTITDLAPDTEYDVRVKAIGDGVNYKSVYSAIVQGKTDPIPVGPVPLAKPVVSVSGKTETTITVSWNAVENAERYSLSYKLASVSTWKNVNVGTNNSYTISGLDSGSMYDVRVKAIGDGVNYKSVYSAVVNARTDEDAPTPFNPRIERTPTTIVITWDPVPNASGISVSIRTVGDSTWMVIRIDSDSSGYTITGLDPDTEYDVRVNLIGDVDNPPIHTWTGSTTPASSAAVIHAMTDPTQSAEPVPFPSPVVTVSGKTDTTITVSWNAVDHADRYSVSYKPTGETTWTNKNAGTNTSYTITGLTPDTEYDIRVKAVGDGVNYKSVYSAIVQGKTDAATPVGPVNLEKPVATVAGKTDTTITVSWNAVDHADRYSVSYKPTGETTWTNKNAGTNTGYTISDLTPDTKYDIRVKAIGDGVNYKSVYSATVQGKTNPAQPSGPVDLEKPVLTVSSKTDTTISVSWNAVDHADRYSVSYKPTGETTWTNKNAGTNTGYTISDLTPDTKYDIRVKAIGDGVNYKSVYSATVQGKTNPAQPSGPVDLEKPVVTVSDKTDTTITVAWNAVDHADRYSLSYKPTGETTWMNKNVGTNTSYTISGLTPNTQYDIRVKAVGDGVNYKSVYSATVKAKTIATPVGPVPLAKPVVSVTGQTGTTITVAWNDVENAERYSLSYKLASDSAWTNVNVWSDTSYTITGLAKNSEYDVRVKAVGDGENFKSAYSDVVHAQTNDSITPLASPAPYSATVTRRTIFISWNAVPNTERYSVSYKVASETTWKNVDAGTNTQYMIKGLEPNTEYDLRIKAVGDGVNYKSVYSKTVGVTTRETDLTYFVSWTPLSDVSGYVVKYRPTGKGAWTSVNAGKQTDYAIASLELDVEYEFQVKGIRNNSYVDVPSCAIMASLVPQSVIFFSQLTQGASATSSESFATVDLDGELFDELDEDDYDLLAVNFII